MSTHLRYQAVLISFLIPFLLNAQQQPATIDSLKRALGNASTAAEKVYWFDNLSRTLMNVNPAASDSVGKELILFAEQSRDRELMFKAYMSNGLRCSYFRGQKAYNARSIEFYEKALAIARQNKLEEKTGEALLQLSEVYLAVPDKDKSLKYASEASSRISNTENDSLHVEGNNMYGKVYLARNDKTLALRHFLTALRIAEDIKVHDQAIKRMKAELKRNCFINLSNFYSSIEDYDRAIDYQTQAYDMLNQLTDKRVPYQRVIDINTIGNLFSAKKSFDIAISYFEKSIRMADSLKFANLKVPGYVSLLNQYLRMEEPGKALNYLNSPQGQSLQGYLNLVGMNGVVDQAYGFVYVELNQFDSARKYLNRALPFFEKNLNENARVSVYLQMGRLFDKSGEDRQAIEYYLKAKEMAEKNGLLDVVITSSKHLDSVYSRLGDYKNARLFNANYFKFKDSSEHLNKEKELAQVEAADEQQRLAKQLREEQELKRRKNNIQYITIIFGIVILFITLVVLGMFRVSATVIKAIGFFVFLILFEFIFLVFKKNIYSITHGEPWKDLAFMIMLAAMLVPLHHWLEHKVLHYLTSHNRLTAAGQHLTNKFLNKGKNMVKE
jgi:tetratricopeptide (TPR) repeat protein